MAQPEGFRPRNFEPARGKDQYGLAVELEFYERVAGLSGDTIIIDLADGATMEQAKRLRDTLADLGHKVRVR